MPVLLYDAREVKIKRKGIEKVILFGRLDIKAELRRALYQRDPIPGHVDKIAVAIRNGEDIDMPPLILHARGDRYTVNGKTISIDNHVFLVDGLQRWSAADIVNEEILAGEFEGEEPCLFAIVHMNSVTEEEARKFKIVNTTSKRINPNKMLLNMAIIDKRPGVKLLHDLSTSEGSFPLFERIQWDDQKKTKSLVTARIFSFTAMALHGFVPASNYEAMANGLDRTLTHIGPNKFTTNIKIFYDKIIEGIWGIRDIAIVKHAHHIKSGFLWCLAEVFSMNKDIFFNKEGILSVSVKDMQKLRTLPMKDKSFAAFCAAQDGPNRTTLINAIADHMNHYRRGPMLKKKAYAKSIEGEPDDPSNET